MKYDFETCTDKRKSGSVKWRTMLKKYPDQDADFSGRLLGGCLDCLVNLKGTEFDKTV